MLRPSFAIADECDESQDLIVLPEYSDVPGDCGGSEGFHDAITANNAAILRKASETAVRCNVFYADTPEEAQKYLHMGIDTVFTNDYLAISNALKLK